MNELLNNDNKELSTFPDFGNDCASFFSMHNTPFTLTPKKSNIYIHQSYLQVKNTLLFGISSGERLIKITGNVGSGKTLLTNDVLSSIDHEHYPIRILNPKILPKDLLCQIIDEFGHPYPVDATIEQLMRLLRFTLHEHYTRTNANMLVWIDDAHLLSTNTLLLVDKISSWSTPTRTLLQFILTGDCLLDERLQHPTLLSLNNNIRFSDYIDNIEKQEVRKYVMSYIQSIDTFDEPQFTEKAFTQLYKHTNGNPSAINKLAYKSLLLAYGKGKRTIKHSYVNDAFFEHENKKNRSSNSKWKITLATWAIINTIFLVAYSGDYL